MRPLIRATALAGSFEGCFCRPRAERATGRKRQFEAIRVGQLLRQGLGEAIARHNIETDSRQQNHPGCFGPFIEGGRRFDHFDLARDVEIMHAFGQTGLHHWPRRCRERSGTIEDQF